MSAGCICDLLNSDALSNILGKRNIFLPNPCHHGVVLVWVGPRVHMLQNIRYPSYTDEGVEFWPHQNWPYMYDYS